MNNKVRTRIAPSPTSTDKTLHLGNVRTALFSYLVAKQAGGDWILRIEDSDTARNVEGCAEGMFDDLVWLGISPTEGFGTNNQPHGPYSQLEKLTRYKQMAEHLMERGLAYKCVCSEELLNKQREEAIARNPKAPFKYPGTCRNLKHDPDNGYVIRFKAPLDGETIHDDLVFGRIVYPNFENYDWVIMRENGTCLYNFGVVIDDMDMEISHVIRGRDHSGFNTLQQIQFYKAFGASLPKFCHLCLINNQEGRKLAKRDGAVSVKSVKQLGYSPSAVLSYIAKLGWGHGNKEVFSLNELVELFDLSNCGKNDARFDFKKFAAINYEHMKTQSLVSDAEYARGMMQFLKERDLTPNQSDVENAIKLIRHKCKTYIEAANELDPILRKDIVIDPAAKEKFLTLSNKAFLFAYVKFLDSIDVWNDQNIKEKTLHWLEENGENIKDVGQPIRVAITGRTNSPELFAIMSILGKDVSIDRLKKAIE